MALSADKLRNSRGAPYQNRLAVATGSTIYVGSLAVRRSTTGRALAATAATGRRIEGVVVRLDGPNGPGAGTGIGNTGGTQYAIIEYGNEHLVTVATAIRTNTSLGLNVFISDDDKVAGTAVGTAAKRLPVGELVAYEASDKSTGWVAIRRFATTNIAV